jgi:hypothetical protein
MNRTEFTDSVKNAMIDTGRISESWRIEITGKESLGNNSDYVDLFLNAYKPRSRKPDVLWTIRINAVKELIYWEHSYFCKVK